MAANMGCSGSAWEIILHITARFHFAHGIEFSIGVYAVVFFMEVLGWSLWLSIVAAIGVAVVAGIASKKFSCQPMRRILAHVPHERTSPCTIRGMAPLSRGVVRGKPRALCAGAVLAGRELGDA